MNFCHMFKKFKFSGRPFCKRTISNKIDWYACVGLEIHAKLWVERKIFSFSSAFYQNLPNSCVSDFDIAAPGTLPVLNRLCVEKALSLASSLNCFINEISTFDRKHYFYPDLPAGYQITQHRIPLAQNGFLEYINFNPAFQAKAEKRKVGIRQIHLEHDSGRSVNTDVTNPDKNDCLIDYNRSGVGLVEIVTEPTLQNGEDCASFINELISLLIITKVNDGHLDLGSLRIDANVSVVPLNNEFNTQYIKYLEEFGDSQNLQKVPRFEIKNLNSTRHLVEAVDYEIDRLKREYTVRDMTFESEEWQALMKSQTRGYDSIKKKTYMMRYKDGALDYRYLPEPNLPNLVLDDSFFPSSQPRKSPLDMPFIPTPNTLARHFNARHGLSLENAFQIARDPILTRLFMAVSKELHSSLNPHHLFSLLSTVVKSHFNKWAVVVESSWHFDPQEDQCLLVNVRDVLIQVSECLQSDTITLSSSKLVMDHFLGMNIQNEEAFLPRDAIKTWIRERNLYQISDPFAIKTGVDSYVKENYKIVQKLMNKKSARRYKRELVADINKHCNGVYNAAILDKILDCYGPS